MLNKDLIDIAHDVVLDFFSKKTHANKTMTFKKITDGVLKLSKMKEDEFNDKIGSFYVDLLQDGRFVYLGHDKWTLKDKITNETFNKNQNVLFANTSTTVQETYDEESLPEEMQNADNEVYDEDKNEISRDSFVNSDNDFDDEDSENSLDMTEISNDEE